MPMVNSVEAQRPVAISTGSLQYAGGNRAAFKQDPAVPSTMVATGIR